MDDYSLTPPTLADDFRRYAALVGEAIDALSYIPNSYMPPIHDYRAVFADYWDEQAFAYFGSHGEQPPLMNDQLAAAHAELETAFRKLSALQDRLTLLARGYQSGEELSAEAVDAKHGIKGHRLNIWVHNLWSEHPEHGDLWANKSLGLSYDQPRDRTADFGLSLLFTSLGFVSNGDTSEPHWTHYGEPPAGKIAKLREGLDALGFKYVHWHKRVSRVAAEIGDDPRSPEENPEGNP